MKKKLRKLSKISLFSLSLIGSQELIKKIENWKNGDELFSFWFLLFVFSLNHFPHFSMWETYRLRQLFWSKSQWKIWMQLGIRYKICPCKKARYPCWTHRLKPLHPTIKPKQGADKIRVRFDWKVNGWSIELKLKFKFN